MQTEIKPKIIQNAIIYCRVSTEEQAEEGYSLDAQEKFCRKFAEANSYRIVEVFRDEGKTGTNIRRQGLQDTLAKCQEDESIKAVLVQETDRLARKTVDHLAIKAILKKADVRLISVAQPMLDDSPEGQMIDTIIASVNQFQSDINSRKTKKGLQEKFDSGYWPGWVPLGYLNSEENAQKITVSDPIRWPLIKKGLKMYLTGNYSALELTDILYEKGLRSKTGKKVCPSIMNAVLRNPFYAGLMHWNNQEKTGHYEPMITLDEHKAILAIMVSHNQHACRRRKHSFLLRGFIFCDICGGRYTAEKHSVKGKGYYHCGAKTSVHTNKWQNVEVGYLEKEIEKYFSKVEFSKDFIDLVIQKVRKFYEIRRGAKEQEKRMFLNKKLGAERKREVLEEKLLAGTIKDEDFMRIRDKVREEINLWQTKVNGLDTQHDLDVDVIRQILMLSNNVAEAYKKAPYEIKRLYLSFFWNGFWVKNQKIVRYEPTELIKTLQNRRKIIIRSNWLRG